MDMDGVLVHEAEALPGAAEFLAALRERELPFLLLTNNSIYTRRDLAARLRASGLDVPEERIWTSASATARFLETQRPGGTAFVVGESGISTQLYQAGYTLTDREPDYVARGGPPRHPPHPRPAGPLAERPAAGDRLGGGADHAAHRRRPLLRRQAEPAD